MSKAENFIEEHIKKSTNEVGVIDATNSHHYHKWLTPDDAKKAVEIAREEMLNDICEWIDVNYVHYLDISVKGTLTANIRQFIGDLKQAIRNE